jgi:hypothetical protein
MSIPCMSTITLFPPCKVAWKVGMIVGNIITSTNDNLQYDHMIDECESKIKAGEYSDIPTPMAKVLEYSQNKNTRTENLLQIQGLEP